MDPLNWIVVAAYLAYVVVDGLRRSKGTHRIEGYFLAGRSLPWWAVGLSVMATQLSAITLIGTTGQGATDGLRFVQFYFGLPLAMALLGVTLVPLLRGAKVYTAYEYLERRFGPSTRALTAFLFLVSRGLAAGTIISAPGVVFSAVFGWPLAWSVALVGAPTVLYTMAGGIQAVTWTDVKQMFLIVAALVAVVAVLFVQMPVSPGDAFQIAGATGRLQVFDFSFSFSEKYTFWSGLFGGTVLMMSYFGADQSQVQRYLAARSVRAAKTSLLMSAYWKIPLQACVLLLGVLIFVFYQFQRPPLLFNPAHERAVVEARADEYEALQSRFDEAFALRETAARQAADAPNETAAARALDAFQAREAAAQEIRGEALALAQEVTGERPEDVNYIVPRFVLGNLPVGFAGLFVAAILAAAMSSVSSELNSLSTATVVDFYRRWFRPEAGDAHYLAVSKVATACWGLFACGVAVYAASLGSLIEVVNRFGSFFYGSILGVFLLAMIPGTREVGAVAGLVAGMTAVGLVSLFAPEVEFLWHNVIGAGVVVAVGTAASGAAAVRARADGSAQRQGRGS